jgi:hypothetical protein
VGREEQYEKRGRQLRPTESEYAKQQRNHAPQQHDPPMDNNELDHGRPL